MANLIIKPTSGGSLILQDEGGTAAHTIDASGNHTLSGTTNNVGTVTAGSIAGGTITSATAFPAGHVIQVVSAVKTAKQSSASVNNTWTAITGLDLSITPSATSSKILVTYHINFAQSSGSHTGVAFGLYRGGSIIATATGDSSGNTRTRVTSGAVHYNNDDSNAYNGSSSMSYLDSPSTTSAVVYQPYIYNASGSAFTSYINRDQNASNANYGTDAISTITCMEISG